MFDDVCQSTGHELIFFFLYFGQHQHDYTLFITFSNLGTHTHTHQSLRTPFTFLFANKHKNLNDFECAHTFHTTEWYAFALIFQINFSLSLFFLFVRSLCCYFLTVWARFTNLSKVGLFCWLWNLKHIKYRPLFIYLNLILIPILLNAVILRFQWQPQLFILNFKVHTFCMSRLRANLLYNNT